VHHRKIKPSMSQMNHQRRFCNVCGTTELARSGQEVTATRASPRQQISFGLDGPQAFINRRYQSFLGRLPRRAEQPANIRSPGWQARAAKGGDGDAKRPRLFRSLASSFLFR